MGDSSVSVVYSSHMIEHLPRAKVGPFLREVHRILKPGGMIRIVTPDLRKLAQRYVNGGAADDFMESSLLAEDVPETALVLIKQLVVGRRGHHWLYDAPSLCRLLERNGFREARSTEPGSTRIQDVGALDLFERADQSVYVEAFK